MQNIINKYFTVFLFLFSINISAQILVGADRVCGEYIDLLSERRIGIICNQTSVLRNNSHLVDTLIKLSEKYNFKVSKIFSPEHGFDGTYQAGEKISNSEIKRLKLPVISLYGKNKKPSAEDLYCLDLLIFDIQDVGARFYTYISTLYYIIEAAAENTIPILILDRSNPIGGNYF